MPGPIEMPRRAFLASIAGGLLAAPLAAEAQQPGKVLRIGILGNVPRSNPEGGALWEAFVQELRTLGYVEGQNVTIEERSCEGQYERLPGLADELVRLNVDVIVVPATENARAAQQATRTIPIVGASLGDPMRAGLVSSLAHPGGNVTGLSFPGPELAGKQVGLLKEMIPSLSRVAILSNPSNPAHPALLNQAGAAARSLRINQQTLEVRGPDWFESAFAAMVKRRAGALLVLPDGMFLLHRTRLADLAAKRRIPSMYALREHVEVGGLAFYGASLRANFRRVAAYVDKILRGAKPGDLPVEQPTKFDLVINLKTAKALGLTIPPSLLQRADQVIE